MSQPPRIAPLTDGVARPRFSVMLPTYRPTDTLAVALASVLTQAPPAAEMQITIVDDGSPDRLVEDMVQSVDRTGRVEIVRHGERLGLAGNWNRAIDLARGTLVHLLHQDDYVLPDFYARLERGLRSAPDAGMAFCRTRLVDGADRFLKNSSRLAWFAGPLRNWLAVIAERQRLQTPAVVVPRATYEQLGGYRADLCQALDWEMWVRIAARWRVWYEPRVLAAYRRHEANESARLLAKGDVWPDVIRTIEINAESLPEQLRKRLTAASARWHAASAIRSAERRLEAGDAAGARATLAHAATLVTMAAGAPRADRVRNRWQAVASRAQTS
jgi:glycosyltransferase involved in cell wall biosynthesis